MNPSARTVFVTLAAAVLGLAVAIAAARATKSGTVSVPKYEPLPPTEAHTAGRRAVGTAGCMAAACHGAAADKLLSGERGPGAWQAAGSCWQAADPHTAAYSLLTDAPRRPVRVTAAQIMGKYRPGTKATDDARCLACHTNPALAALEPAPDVVALREQGVSCEACHGNAGEWLQPHTTWTGDRTKPYRDTGMRPLFDLGARALACAGCHVGAPAGDGAPVRDMNHDMIAAGHPRLDFDFAEYQRRLPQHWQEKDRTTAGSPQPCERNEAQVWYVGRVAHAEAASRLLASRAARAEARDTHTPWPEFAEFNCAACHHKLDIPASDTPRAGWRTSEAYLDGRSPGSVPWQTIWPVTSAAGLPHPRRATANVAPLVRLMEGETGEKDRNGQTVNTRYARSDKAQALAATTADALAVTRHKLTTGAPKAVEAEARALFPTGAPLVPEWDSARQLFFGHAALEYARGRPDAATVNKYRAGADAFRARDWARVETAFKALR